MIAPSPGSGKRKRCRWGGDFLFVRRRLAAKTHTPPATAEGV
jgi:hypothetical protein